MMCATWELRIVRSDRVFVGAKYGRGHWAQRASGLQVEGCNYRTMMDGCELQMGR